MLLASGQGLAALCDTMPQNSETGAFSPIISSESGEMIRIEGAEIRGSTCIQGKVSIQRGSVKGMGYVPGSSTLKPLRLAGIRSDGIQMSDASLTDGPQLVGDLVIIGSTIKDRGTYDGTGFGTSPRYVPELILGSYEGNNAFTGSFTLATLGTVKDVTIEGAPYIKNGDFKNIYVTYQGELGEGATLKGTAFVDGEVGPGTFLDASPSGTEHPEISVQAGASFLGIGKSITGQVILSEALVEESDITGPVDNEDFLQIYDSHLQGNALVSAGGFINSFDVFSSSINATEIFLHDGSLTAGSVSGGPQQINICGDHVGGSFTPIPIGLPNTYCTAKRSSK